MNITKSTRMKSEITQALAIARLEMTTYTRSVGGILFSLLMPFGLFMLATSLWYPKEVWTAAVPHMSMFVVISSGLFSIGVAVTQQRMDGTLKTYLSSPLSARAYLAGQVIDRVVITLIGIIVMLLLARIVRGVSPTGSLIVFLLCLLVALTAMISFGFLLATRFTSVEVAGGSSSLLFLVIMLISGFIPMSLPDWFHTIIAWLPFQPIAKLLEISWLDPSFANGWQHLGVITLWTLIFLALAAKFFRWSGNDR